MEQFVQGQKLTASQLNSAFEKVGGPMNPSNDYQWTKTDYGNLQTTWDTFVQVQNQNPKTLDVGIGYSKIGSETVVEIDGKKPAALRRVFINVGPPRMNHLANISIPGIPSFGTSNNFPIIGIVGLQYYGAGRYIQGDSKYHFSIFDIASGYPSKGETPQQWEQKQKLWQDDVARGCDSRNWWYSGITLERADPRREDEQRLKVGNDLVCFPMYLLFTPVEQSGFANDDLNRVIESRVLLCVMLQEDYWGLNHIGEFAQGQEFMTQLERMYGTPGLGITVAFAPNWGMFQTLATYVVSDTNTQNAYYHQLINQVKFNQDTGPWRIAGFTSNLFTESPIHPYILGTTWIDQNGTQRGFEKDRIILNVVDADGTPVGSHDEVWDMFLACGYNQNTMTKPVLSCVRNNDLTDLPDDGVQGLLSGLFNEEEYGLSSDMQKRLVWISRNDTHGVQYYDTCPDFRTGDTPDSEISASCLSSIQEKDIELVSEEGQETQSQKLWSLWEFDNFENSKTYPEIQDNLSAYDLVVRHIDKRGEDTVGIVEYVHLSSLELSGGNLPDADVPASGTKSIETRTLTGGEKVIQLYDFDDGQAQNVYLSAQGHYDFIVRDNDNHCVKYANLSGIGGEVTLSGTDGSSSTGSEWKFQAFANSNISVHISPQTIQMGCYYI